MITVRPPLVCGDDTVVEPVAVVAVAEAREQFWDAVLMLMSTKANGLKIQRKRGARVRLGVQEWVQPVLYPRGSLAVVVATLLIFAGVRVSNSTREVNGR